MTHHRELRESAYWLLALLAGLLLVRILPAPDAARGLASYLPLHTIMEMLSIADGATQYSLVLPGDAPARRYDEYLSLLRRRHRSTLLGYATPDAPLTAILNADDDAVVPPGATLFYLASRRVDAHAVLHADGAQAG